MVFNTSNDGSSASTFHYYCDGVSPTVIIVRDTNGNKFGGYTTSIWNQPGPGGNYGRDPDAFIFNLSKKTKYLQTDKYVYYSIYRNNSYGPTFGGGHNLYLADGCTSNTNKDGSSASTFHYYCDGVSPTVTIVRDTSGNKFGGYTTSTWNQPGPGANYGRDQDAFIFNLSKKIKYLQTDKFVVHSIYRHNSYGPTFGGGHCLYLADSCTGNSSSYTNTHSSYKTDNKNLIGNSGSTSFQVSYYEVYHVVEE